jgi:hypothetical protein
MAISTTAGAKIFIGAVHLAATDTAAEYAALTGWTEIGEVENLGELGDESGGATFTGIAYKRVKKLKTADDAGTLPLICGRDPLDAGQIALKAAQATKYDYNFKIVLADAPNEDYLDSVFYFAALVMSGRNNLGAQDNVTRISFNLGINT